MDAQREISLMKAERDEWKRMYEQRVADAERDYKQFRAENKRLRAALEEIRRIAHPYGEEKRMADKALAAIDAAKEK